MSFLQIRQVWQVDVFYDDQFDMTKDFDVRLGSSSSDYETRRRVFLRSGISVKWFAIHVLKSAVSRHDRETECYRLPPLDADEWIIHEWVLRCQRRRIEAERDRIEYKRKKRENVRRIWTSFNGDVIDISNLIWQWMIKWMTVTKKDPMSHGERMTAGWMGYWRRACRPTSRQEHATVKKHWRIHDSEPGAPWSKQPTDRATVYYLELCGIQDLPWWYVIMTLLKDWSLILTCRVMDKMQGRTRQPTGRWLMRELPRGWPRAWQCRWMGWRRWTSHIKQSIKLLKKVIAQRSISMRSRCFLDKTTLGRKN